MKTSATPDKPEPRSSLASLLAETSIHLTAAASDRDDAIRLVGAALVEVGAVDPSYVDTMIERENSVSTYLGEGVAVPHSTRSGRSSVARDAIVFFRFPEGVAWDGNEVHIVVGIAAQGNGHIAMLLQLARVLLDPDKASALRDATTKERVYEVLATSADS